MTTHTNESNKVGKGSYAEVNGLKMYYEIHGTGKPLVLLPGGLMTIGMMGQILPDLAKTRQVIAVEVQGHGHTADIDRPLTYEQVADDIEPLSTPGTRTCRRLRLFFFFRRRHRSANRHPAPRSGAQAGGRLVPL